MENLIFCAVKQIDINKYILYNRLQKHPNSTFKLLWKPFIPFCKKYNLDSEAPTGGVLLKKCPRKFCKIHRKTLVPEPF